VVTDDRLVYRFTHTESTNDPRLRDDFRSDRESGKRPFAREKAIPELQDGMSMFGSLDAARTRWRDMAEIAASRGEDVRAGYFIAEVLLRPENDFALEDLGEVDEHLTVWGDPDRLAGAVTRIYPASTEES
jgi:hypothetical protein